MKTLAVLLLLATPVAAQVRPGNFSTLNTTDTSADSVHVGCAVGSSTCTGGIKAGIVAAATSLSIGGGVSITSSSNIALLNVQNTFTLSTNAVFGQSITNTNAGSSALARLAVGNDADSALGRLIAYSSTTSTSGIAGANVTAVTSNGLLNLGTTGSAPMGLYTNNTKRWEISANGDLAFGTSARLALSNGTPTIASGFAGGNIGIANDYFHTVNMAASTPSGNITFGHTFSTAPQVIAYQDVSSTRTVCVISNVTTTGYSMACTSVASPTTAWVTVTGG